MMALRLAELQELSDDEVIKRYDKIAKHTQVGAQYYMDELNRRYQERQTDSMLRFTKWISVSYEVI